MVVIDLMRVVEGRGITVLNDIGKMESKGKTKVNKTMY